MIKRKSFKTKLWIYFMVFAALIFSVLWLLQTVFLQSFYNDMLIDHTKTVAKKIVRNSSKENFSDMIDELSLSNCILVYITDTDGAILYSSDQFKRLSVNNGEKFEDGKEDKDQFVSDISNYYKGEVMKLDFSSSNALKAVNDWSNRHTGGMIPKLMDQLNEDAALMLMNAISFKATWTEKFDEKDTQTETFTKEDGTTQSVQMMHRHAIARVGEETDCYTLLLPYGSGDKWGMTIFLPKEGKTVRDVINSLDMSKWLPYNYGSASPMDVDIKLPRFESSYKADVKSALQKMGVESVFDANKADLSLISKNRNLYVYKITQTAAIEVNEEGTKASAVTVAGADIADLFLGEKVCFYANTPFVYMIREASSGAVFFIGTYQGE